MVEALDTNARLSAQFREMMHRFRAFLRSIIEVGQQPGRLPRRRQRHHRRRGLCRRGDGRRDPVLPGSRSRSISASTCRRFSISISRGWPAPATAPAAGGDSDGRVSSRSEEQQLIRDTVRQLRRASRSGRWRARPTRAARCPSALVQQAWELGLVQNAIPEALRRLRRRRARRSPARWSARSSAGPTCRSRCTSWRRAWSPTRCSSSAATRSGRTVLPAFTGARFAAGTAAVIEPRFNFDVNELHDHGGARTTATSSSTAPSATCRSPPTRAHPGLRARRAGPQRLLVPRDAPRPHRRRAREEHGPQGRWRPTSCSSRTAACRRRSQLQRRLAGRCSTARASRCASLAVGVARAAFEYARDYAKERKAFGVAIAPEAGDRLHARRDGDRDRRHAPADLGGGVEDRPRRGRHPRGLPGAQTTPPTWR